jgi:hypothetical protein
MSVSGAVQLERPTDSGGVGYGSLQGMRVAADGTITYDFDGHVHATGFDLDVLHTTPPVYAVGEGPLNAPPPPPTPDGRVRWLAANGAVVADCLAEDEGDPSGSFAYLRAKAPNRAAATLNAQGGQFAELFAQAGAPGDSLANTFIYCQAGGHGTTIADANDSSDFLLKRAAAIVDTGGPWATFVPPNGTSGIPFTVNATGPVLLCCTVSGYAVTTGIGIIFHCWIDGFDLRSIGANPSAPVNSHQEYVQWIVTSLGRGTHYWWLQQTSGSSDAADYANLTVLS